MCELWTTYTTNIDDPNTVIDTLGQDGEVPSGHSVQVQVVQAQVLPESNHSLISQAT